MQSFKFLKKPAIVFCQLASEALKNFVGSVRFTLGAEVPFCQKFRQSRSKVKWKALM